jgi:hypothetical protein
LSRRWEKCAFIETPWKKSFLLGGCEEEAWKPMSLVRPGRLTLNLSRNIELSEERICFFRN